MHACITSTIASWMSRVAGDRGCLSSTTSGACLSRHARTPRWNLGQRFTRRTMSAFITRSTPLKPRTRSPGRSVKPRTNPKRLPARNRRATNASPEKSVTRCALPTTSPAIFKGGRRSLRMSTAAMRVVTNIGPPASYALRRSAPAKSAVISGGNGVSGARRFKCTRSARFCASFNPRMSVAPSMCPPADFPGIDVEADAPLACLVASVALVALVDGSSKVASAESDALGGADARGSALMIPASVSLRPSPSAITVRPSRSNSSSTISSWKESSSPSPLAGSGSGSSAPAPTPGRTSAARVASPASRAAMRAALW